MTAACYRQRTRHSWKDEGFIMHKSSVARSLPRAASLVLFLCAAAVVSGIENKAANGGSQAYLVAFSDCSAGKSNEQNATIFYEKGIDGIFSRALKEESSFRAAIRRIRYTKNEETNEECALILVNLFLSATGSKSAPHHKETVKAAMKAMQPSWKLIELRPSVERKTESIFLNRTFYNLTRGARPLGATHGYIASPNFPGHYQAGHRQTWEIESADSLNGQIRVTILALNLAYDARRRTCLDSLEIYDRYTRRFRHCQLGDSAKPKVIVSSFPNVKITFTSGSEQRYENSGFLLHWQAKETKCTPNPCLNGGVCETDKSGFAYCKCPAAFAGVFCDLSGQCGGVIEAEQRGTVQSPYYPVGYVPGSACHWIISAPLDHIIYHKIVKLFLDDASECRDFLTIRQGTPQLTSVPLMKHYCGDQVTGEMQTEFDTLDIQLTCNSGTSFPGFLLSYEIAPNFCMSNPCNDHQICSNNRDWFTCTCKSGYTGSNCEYEIDYCAATPCKNDGTCVSKRGGYECLCSEAFTGTHCEKDICENYEGCYNKGICRINDNGLPTCSCPPDYVGEDCSVLRCGTHEADYFTQTSGTFRSPQFPLERPSRFRCAYHFRSSGSNHVWVFKFPKIHLRSYYYDQITVHNSSQPSRDNIVQKISGDHDNVAILAQSSNAVVILSAQNDLTSSNYGFSLEFTRRENPCAERTCGVNHVCIPTPEGHNCSCAPGYTGRGCSERIDLCHSLPCQNGGICKMAADQYKCLCQDAFTGPHCQYKINPCAAQPCQNSGTCVVEGDSFTCKCLPYYYGKNCEIVNCTNVLLKEHRGSIATPGYPWLDYPANVSCSWQFLNGDPIMAYTFIFPTFSVEGPSQTCDNDYLEINSAGEGSPMRFCGKEENRRLTLSGPVKMRFRSNEIIEEKGFNLAYQYSLIGMCNSTLTSSEGIFFLPSMEIYKKFKGDVCIWRISPGNSKQIELTISVGRSTAGRGDYSVEVYDSLDQIAEHMVAKISSEGTTTFSVSNTASVKILLANQDFLRFKASYKSANIALCETLSCPLNSSCIMKDDVVHCVCDDGFTNIRGNCINLTCRDLICQNGGHCNYDPFSGASCICQANFSGTYCEKDDLCDAYPCHSAGGICVHQHALPVCLCNPGFTGEFCSERLPAFRCGEIVENFPYAIRISTDKQKGRCEWYVRAPSQRHAIYINLDGIDLGPDCSNGELVVMDIQKNVLSRLCQVPSENPLALKQQHIIIRLEATTSYLVSIMARIFLGENLCDSRSIECPEHSKCSFNTTAAFCVCDDDYTGDKCDQKREPCVNVNCHHGFCVSAEGKFTCICKPRFTGRYCEEEFDECVSQPCQNGGSCYGSSFGYQCHCIKGYYGKNCEKEFCKYNLEGTSGLITSPRFPNSYANNVSCSWKVTAPPHHFIALRISEMDVEGVPRRCNYDSLKIYDGENSGAELLLSACGKVSDHSIAVRSKRIGGSVSLLFTTDDSVAGSGFKVIWNATHEKCLVKECPANSACAVGANDELQCICDSGCNGTGCEVVNLCKHITCGNGGICQKKKGDFTCVCPPEFTGQFCDIDVNECTSSPCANEGMCINDYGRFHCVCLIGFTGRLCEEVIHHEVIDSETQIKVNSSVETTQWTLLSRDASLSHVIVEFTFINLSREQAIRVSEGSKNYCTKLEDLAILSYGAKHAQAITSYGNSLIVTFVNNEKAITRPVNLFLFSVRWGQCPPGLFGPSCAYKAADEFDLCDWKIIGQLNGKLKYRSRYGGTNCSTTINFGALRKVDVRFLHLEFGAPSDACKHGYVELLDGTASSGKSFGKFCDQPFGITLYVRLLSVSLVTANASAVGGISFQLKWNAEFDDILEHQMAITATPEVSTIIGLNKSEGTKKQSEQTFDISLHKRITAESGYLTSPNFPKPYLANQEFVVTFIGDKVTVFLFELSHMQLEKPNALGYCYDALAFYDSTSLSEERVLKVACGNESATVVSQQNIVSLLFRADSSVELTGFRLHFRQIYNRCVIHKCPPNSHCANTAESQRCECDSRRTGMDCREAIDYCDDSPCRLGRGTCATEPAGYHCLCEQRYTGASCQYDRTCPENYCLHKGTCLVDSAGKPFCVCHQPFYGQFCEKSNCTMTMVVAERSVRSPNFPWKYPPNIECTWTFITPNRGHVFLITLRSVEIDCPGDFLRMDIGANETVEICEESQAAYFSRGNRITFAFTSDGFDERKGFEIYIKAVADGCKQLSCPKNSICTAKKDGTAVCSCLPGFTGPNCEASIHPCDEHPCINNGICESLDLVTFTCKCEKAFTGRRCEIARNPCLPNPCLNGGICQREGNGYTCKCFPPTIGTNCERCAKHKEVAEGEHVSFGHPSGYSNDLICGWKLGKLPVNGSMLGVFLNITEFAVDASYQHDYLEILSSAGSQLVHPTNSTETTFFLKGPEVSVVLRSGHTGTGVRRLRFKFYKSFDYCRSYPCENNGTCRNNLRNAGFHGRTCECQLEQFHGYSCETRGYFKCGQLPAKQPTMNGIIATPTFPRPYEPLNCSWSVLVPDGFLISVEFLALNTNRHCPRCCHQASYVQIEGEGQTSLRKRFCGNSVPPLFYTTATRAVVKFMTSSVDHSGAGFLLAYDAVPNKCIGFNCHPNQTCVLDRKREAVCLCPDNYYGESCEKELDLCETEDIACQNGGTCISSHEKWSCRCSAGFSGDFCEDDVWCKESTCSYQGQCVHGTDGPSCECYSGFTGAFCENVICGGSITGNEGIITPPRNMSGASAHYYFKGASCLWNFAVSDDKCVHLLFDFVDLATDYADCKLCAPESLDIYYLDNATKEKQRIRSLCDEDDQIEIVSPSNNLLIDYKTIKDTDYEHLGFQVRYIVDTNDCAADKCGGNRICVDGLSGSYKCVCKPGYTGSSCEEKYSACRTYFEPCLSGQCVDILDTFTCVCDPGYTGRLCEKRIDYCASSPCIYGTCNSLQTSYTCDCFDYGSYYAYGRNCDGIICAPATLSEEAGEVQSPFYPHAYPRNLECSWLLDFQYNRVLALTFDRMSLDPANCDQDYIDIFYGTDTHYDGSVPSSKRLCGQERGEQRLVIPSPTAKIVLKTGNATANFSGFHLFYKAEVPSICNTYACSTGTCKVLDSGEPVCDCPEGMYGKHCEIKPEVTCGSRLTDATNSLVLSTGHSTGGAECRSEIAPYQGLRMMDKKTHLRVLFSTLQPVGCQENYLEINSADEEGLTPTEPLRICSSVAGLASEEMAFSSGSIKLRLKTNGTAHKVALSYSIDFCRANRVTCHEGSRCVNTMNAEEPFKCLCPRHSTDLRCLSAACQNLVLTGDAGWFSSPNYPADYPSGINCSWTISTYGRPAEVTFDFIDLEGKHPECTNDYIEIRTSRNGTIGEKLTRLCGELIEQKFISLSGKVQVSIHSDSFISGKGFAARYNAVQNPCHYFKCLNGGTCKVTLDLPEPVCLCPRGYNGRFCERRTVCPDNYCLNGGTCYLAGANPECICVANFAGNRCQEVLCDQLHYSGTSFSLSLKPSEGSSPANCTFYLDGPKNMPISVSLDDLNLDNHGDCENGFIEVYQGFSQAKKALIAKFCKSENMPALIGTTKTNKLLLVARIYKWTSATTLKGRVLRDFSCNGGLCRNAPCIQEPNIIRCDCPGGYGGPKCKEPLCGQIIRHKDEGTIRSYPASAANGPFSYCFYAINAKEESIIYVYLFAYIPEDEPKNTIVAFNGPDETYDRVNLSRNEVTFLSKGNAFSILLTLVREDEAVYRPPFFEALYTRVPLEVEAREPSGEISSFDPAFGEFDRLERNFTISVPKAKRIFINILYFNIGECKHNSISIHCKGNATRLCDIEAGWSNVFNTNILRIELNFTRYVDEYQGFSANYTTSETEEDKENCPFCVH